MATVQINSQEPIAESTRIPKDNSKNKRINRRKVNNEKAKSFQII
jgi:hypothetical protein